MKEIQIKSFLHYVEMIDKIVRKDTYMPIYRGQCDDNILLPAIARKNPKKDTTAVEIKMLDELKRRMASDSHKSFLDNWDWLVYAQHFGMMTRLLDWTSNPLTALWFASKNHYKIGESCFVYAFLAKRDEYLNRSKVPDPFKSKSTLIFRPPQNNERVIAQAGWFTAHRYAPKYGRFVALEHNRLVRDRLVKFIIPDREKEDILKRLNVFGINHQSMFPDIEGTCTQLNWEFKDALI